MCHSFFIHSSVDGYLGCFHVLANVNRAAMSFRIHVSFSNLVSSRYIPSSRIFVLCGNLILRFLRNLHTALLCSCINLHSHQQCKKVPYCPAFIVCRFFIIMAILIDIRWYLVVVLICIYLIMSDVQHLFMCLLAICMSFLSTFWLGCLFFWYWVV